MDIWSPLSLRGTYHADLCDSINFIDHRSDCSQKRQDAQESDKPKATTAKARKTTSSARATPAKPGWLKKLQRTLRKLLLFQQICARKLSA